MRLEWRTAALQDRDEIVDYVLVESPRAAVALDLAIEQHADKLMEFPELGRPGRAKNTRELIIPDTPYILAYRIERDAVVALRVLHAARRWPRRIP